MKRLARIVTDLLSPDVRKDSRRVTRIFGDQFAHETYRICNAFRVRIVESKAHPKHVASNKALFGIGEQRLRVCVAAVVEQKSSNPRHLAAVETIGAVQRA